MTASPRGSEPPNSAVESLARERLGERFGGVWLHGPTQRIQLGVVGPIAPVDESVIASILQEAEASTHVDIVGVSRGERELTEYFAQICAAVEPMNAEAQAKAELRTDDVVGKAFQVRTIDVILRLDASVVDVEFDPALATDEQRAFVSSLQTRYGDAVRISERAAWIRYDTALDVTAGTRVISVDDRRFPREEMLDKEHLMTSTRRVLVRERAAVSHRQLKQAAPVRLSQLGPAGFDLAVSRYDISSCPAGPARALAAAVSCAGPPRWWPLIGCSREPLPSPRCSGVAAHQ